MNVQPLTRWLAIQRALTIQDLPGFACGGGVAACYMQFAVFKLRYCMYY